MNKRKRTQYVMEFVIDFFSLAISATITTLFFITFTNKILTYETKIWVEYFILLALSFVIVELGFYSPINIEKKERFKEIGSVFRNELLVFLTFTAMLALFRNLLVTSRYLLVFIFVLDFFVTCFDRFILKHFFYLVFNTKNFATLAAVVTTSDRAENFLEGMEEDWTREILGVALLDKPYLEGKQIHGISIFADKTNFLDKIRNASLDEVFIDIPFADKELVQPIVEEIESMGITVYINMPTLEFIHDKSDYEAKKIDCKFFAGIPMAKFAATTFSVKTLFLKRLMDIAGGLVGSIACIVIMAFVYIPLKVDSKGKMIFKQTRIGENGRQFTCYKIRSMVEDAEDIKESLQDQNEMEGVMFKMADDPRVTKVGKFLRRTSLDEFPQFFNVLKGDMSLVGTRPPTVEEFQQYASHQKRRLAMKPGITGMWQVSGRSEIDNFDDIVKLDLYYIDNWSLLLDIKLIFKTVGVVLRQKGAE